MSESPRSPANTEWLVGAIDGLQMHPDDCVATALRDLRVGDKVRVSCAGLLREVTLRDPVALCHKFALVDIARGESVRKYGEAIGAARIAIAAGEHVHVHNLVSLRACAKA